MSGGPKRSSHRMARGTKLGLRSVRRYPLIGTPYNSDAFRRHHLRLETHRRLVCTWPTICFQTCHSKSLSLRHPHFYIGRRHTNASCLHDLKACLTSSTRLAIVGLTRHLSYIADYLGWMKVLNGVKRTPPSYSAIAYSALTFFSATF